VLTRSGPFRLVVVDHRAPDFLNRTTAPPGALDRIAFSAQECAEQSYRHDRSVPAEHPAAAVAPTVRHVRRSAG